MSGRAHRIRIGRAKVSWPTVLWLGVVWMLLWSDVSVGTAVAGMIIGIVVTVLLPLPAIGYAGRVRPLGVVRLVGHFVADLVMASFQVAFLALSPSHVPHGAVIRVQLRNESDLFLTLTAQLSTLVPGSVVVEALRRNGMLYLHVLDIESMGGIEGAKAKVLAVEERVLRALASSEDLERAGLIGGRR